MERPVIGIMGNTYMTQPGMFDSMERAYQNSYYVDAVMKNGGIPVILPASAVMEQTEEIMGICDGILFPGGEDMTPSYYGEDPHPAIQVYKPEIDEALMRAGRYALEHGKPMLGICKGSQLLNVLMVPCIRTFPLRGLTASGTCSLAGGITLPTRYGWRREPGCQNF